MGNPIFMWTVDRYSWRYPLQGTISEDIAFQNRISNVSIILRKTTRLAQL